MKNESTLLVVWISIYCLSVVLWRAFRELLCVLLVGLMWLLPFMLAELICMALGIGMASTPYYF